MAEKRGCEERNCAAHPLLDGAQNEDADFVGVLTGSFARAGFDIIIIIIIIIIFIEVLLL